MSTYFDDELLETFMRRFLGYGKFAGPYWFIGMEEGGGGSFEEVAKRLSVWDRRGQRELEDVAEYHLALGIDHLFGAKPRLQPTWAALIRMYLSAQGESPTTEDVRRHQARHWATTNGDVCLMELLPLPSPSTSDWLYAQHSKLPHLQNRNVYRKHWSERRIQLQSALIKTHQPRAVIFYGSSYLSYWTKVAGTELRLTRSGTAYASNGSQTLFIATKHPAARGVTNDYFHGVGQFVRDVLARAGQPKPA